jgi:hypothetical protein
VLATLIWHEMAHIAVADEREAQRQEEERYKAPSQRCGRVW